MELGRGKKRRMKKQQQRQQQFNKEGRRRQMRRKRIEGKKQFRKVARPTNEENEEPLEE